MFIRYKSVRFAWGGLALKVSCDWSNSFGGLFLVINQFGSPHYFDTNQLLRRSKVAVKIPLKHTQIN